MMFCLPRMALALIVLTPAGAVLPGCGGGGRVTTFPGDAQPTATAVQTVIRITEVVRRPGELELALSIANAAADPVAFARTHGQFSAAIVAHGGTRIVGERSPGRSRTLPPNRYTVLAGEEASLRLVFRAADVDSATGLTLHLAGSTRGNVSSWTIAIPPETSLSTAMSGNT